MRWAADGSMATDCSSPSAASTAWRRRGCANRCGVAGVLRAELLAALPRVECLGAGELFLSSSIRGILPVQAVGDRVFTPGPVASAMPVHWRGLGFTREQA